MVDRSIYMQDTQAALILGLRPNTLRKWRVLGRGPRYRKLGRSVRYSASDLEEWLNTRPTGGERVPIPVGGEAVVTTQPGEHAC